MTQVVVRRIAGIVRAAPVGIGPGERTIPLRGGLQDKLPPQELDELSRPAAVNAAQTVAQLWRQTSPLAGIHALAQLIVGQSYRPLDSKKVENRVQESARRFQRGFEISTVPRQDFTALNLALGFRPSTGPAGLSPANLVARLPVNASRRLCMSPAFPDGEAAGTALPGNTPSLVDGSG